ncbi:MAG TPA: CBS domain-containing protein [Acidobacteriaceae bacterium]|jgi:CBS domain-containing protein
MSEPTANTTSVSTLLGMPVVDPQGQPYGRVREFAVDLSDSSGRIKGLLLRGRKDGKTRSTFLPIEKLTFPEANDKVLHAVEQPEAPPKLDDFLLMDRDVLDQQIIDVDGRKVVRVNDVGLTWETRGTTPELRIADVEVGMRGATRRLLKGLPNAGVFHFSNYFTARAIPWTCVDLIERDPARRVRLKIEQARLAKLHPSDIAAILEELAPAEREAIFTSLPEETAAETLEEIEPKMQKELVQRMDSERAADIIEEMDPGAAADLLSGLSDEESEAILEEMEPEERHDVEELLEFSSDSAAGRMTNYFVEVPQGATVAEAVEALRAFEGDADTITEVYLLNEQQHLKGVVTLPRLLLAERVTKLDQLSEEHIVSCRLHASDKEVAELFDKYNLRSLPVVDTQSRLAGVIHAEQVIAQLRDG